MPRGILNDQLQAKYVNLTFAFLSSLHKTMNSVSFRMGRCGCQPRRLHHASWGEVFSSSTSPFPHLHSGHSERTTFSGVAQRGL